MRKLLIFATLIVGINSNAQVRIESYSRRGFDIVYQNCDDSILYFLSPMIIVASMKNSNTFYVRLDRMFLVNDTLAIYINDTLIAGGSTKPYKDLMYKHQGLWRYDTLRKGETIIARFAFRRKMVYDYLQINYSIQTTNGEIEDKSLLIPYHKKKKYRKNAGEHICGS